MKLKYKVAGSQMSTCRMFTRMGDFLCSLRFFIGKLNAFLKGNLKFCNESGIEWVIKFVDFWSGVFDNWVYLNRTKLRVWQNKWQEAWVDWLSSACCITVILLSMVDKFVKIYYTSVKEVKSQGICYKRDSSGGSLIESAENSSSENE